MQDGTGQREELRAASVRFLGNVKARFGEHAFQVSDVHKTLDLFTQRVLSKRKTHKTILDTLEGHADLKQELMDILTHPAASWTPGDFDLPTQQSTQTQLETIPQYLQPAHQPHMRLPSFSSWFTLPHNDQSASPAMLTGHDDFGGLQSLASSPSAPIPLPFQVHDQPNHTWTDPHAEAAYRSFHEDGFLASPIQTAFHNPWDDSNNADNWTKDAIDFPVSPTALGKNFDNQEAPALPLLHDPLQASMPYPHQAQLYTTSALPQHEGSHPLQISHRMHGTVLAPIDQDVFWTVDLEDHPVELHAHPSLSCQSPASVSQTEDIVESTDTNETTTVASSLSLGGPFIHIICGKGFATLTGVKKHHWGKKVNDLATTTGCWAKQGKPDVAWDEHSSCKDERMNPRTKKGGIIAFTPQFTAASAIDIPQLQPLPRSSTLDGLPYVVARNVHAVDPSTFFGEEPETTTQTPRLAPRSSFESLLTAVNVVSQIDSPQPKGRADPITGHLNVQVAAAKQRSSFMPFEPANGRPLIPTHYRAIASAAFSMNDSSVAEDFSPHTSGHPVDLKYASEERPSVLPSDAEQPHVAGALSRPFQSLQASSAGPARKKRKV